MYIGSIQAMLFSAQLSGQDKFYIYISCIFEQIGSLWFWSNISPFLLQKIASASPKEICIWQRAFGVKHCLKIIIIIPILSFPFCKFVLFFAKKNTVVILIPKGKQMIIPHPELRCTPHQLHYITVWCALSFGTNSY